VARHISRAFTEAGYGDLRPAHMSIMQHVDHPPRGTRISELAERAQMTKQSMGQLVSDMASLGYVELVPDPVDRRAKIVRLTDSGWEMHEAAGEIGKSLEKDWGGRIGADNFDQLRRLLKQLIAALDR
jgi:DNA-binding MarR family transcriptional regulator